MAVPGRNAELLESPADGMARYLELAADMTEKAHTQEQRAVIAKSLRETAQAFREPRH